MKPEKVTVNLFGARGDRAVSIQPKGGFPTRHVKVPQGTPSLFGDVALGKLIQPKTPTETPAPTLLEVIRFMHASANHSGWLILDEILFVATAHYKMKFNQHTLLDALQERHKQGELAYRRNAFDQHTFQLIEGTALRSLLMEVDAILEGGQQNG